MQRANKDIDGPIAWTTMGVLAILFLVSYVDRQLISLVVEDIKHDLDLTDVQAGLVTGMAFALTYSTMAIPIAYLSDRWSRRKVIVIGVSLWGSLTCLCGFANSFTSLSLSRMGVGVGEAALTPNGYALATELFSTSNQARAMSLFIFGSAVGSGASLLFGGALLNLVYDIQALAPIMLGEISSWRLLFGFVGGMTLLCLFLTPLIATGSALENEPVEGASTAHVVRSLWDNKRQLIGLFVGIPFLNLVQFGLLGWLPTYYIRVRGWHTADAGVTIGTVLIVAGVLSVIATAAFSAPLQKRRVWSADGLYVALVVTQVVAIPIIYGIVELSSPMLSMTCVGLWAFTTSLINVIAPVFLQKFVPRGGRAQAGALWLFVVNMVGIGLGPAVVAATARLGMGEQGIGSAIVIVGTVGTTIGSLLLASSIYCVDKSVRLSVIA